MKQGTSAPIQRIPQQAFPAEIESFLLRSMCWSGTLLDASAFHADKKHIVTCSNISPEIYQSLHHLNQLLRATIPMHYDSLSVAQKSTLLSFLKLTFSYQTPAYVGASLWQRPLRIGAVRTLQRLLVDTYLGAHESLRSTNADPVDAGRFLRLDPTYDYAATLLASAELLAGHPHTSVSVVRYMYRHEACIATRATLQRGATVWKKQLGDGNGSSSVLSTLANEDVLAFWVFAAFATVATHPLFAPCSVVAEFLCTTGVAAHLESLRGTSAVESRPVAQTACSKRMKSLLGVPIPFGCTEEGVSALETKAAVKNPAVMVWYNSIQETVLAYDRAVAYNQDMDERTTKSGGDASDSSSSSDEEEDDMMLYEDCAADTMTTDVGAMV